MSASNSELGQNEQDRAKAKHAAEVVKLLYERGFTVEPECLDYLTRVRKISYKVIEEAVRRHILRFMPSIPGQAATWLRMNVGDGLLKAAGLYSEKHSIPPISIKPIVAILPNACGAEFRVPSADHKVISFVGDHGFPWAWKGKMGKAYRIAVVYGWMDMLSLVDMGWKGSIIALPGLTSWKSKFDDWFSPWWSKDYYHNAEFVIMLGHDREQKVAKDLAGQLKKCGRPVVIRNPKNGDINDILRTNEFLRSVVSHKEEIGDILLSNPEMLDSLVTPEAIEGLIAILQDNRQENVLWDITEMPEVSEPARSYIRTWLIDHEMAAA